MTEAEKRNSLLYIFLDDMRKIIIASWNTSRVRENNVKCFVDLLVPAFASDRAEHFEEMRNIQISSTGAIHYDIEVLEKREQIYSILHSMRALGEMAKCHCIVKQFIDDLVRLGENDQRMNDLAQAICSESDRMIDELCTRNPSCKYYF